MDRDRADRTPKTRPDDSKLDASGVLFKALAPTAVRPLAAETESEQI